MSFMERARSLYERGEHVRTAFVLAEGIKRDPSREDALHWFLQVYVEDVNQPGLEQELVRVVEMQPNGTQLLDLVCDEMRERQQFERLSFLERVRTLRDRAARARDDLQAGAYPRRPSAPPGTGGAGGGDAQDPVSALHAAERARSGPRNGDRRAARARLSQTDELERSGAEAFAPPPPPPPSDSTLAEDLDDDDLPPALAIPRAPRGPRRARKRPQLSVPQGVLDLDANPRPARDDWGSFKGLAGEPTAQASAATTGATSVSDTIPDPRPARRSRRERRELREPTVPPPSPPPAPAVTGTVTMRTPRDLEQEPTGTMPLALEATAPPRSELADTAPDPPPARERRRFLGARWADRAKLDVPDLDDDEGADDDLVGSGPAAVGDDDAAEDWSFGAPLRSVEGRHDLGLDIDIDGTERDGGGGLEDDDLGDHGTDDDLDDDGAVYSRRRKRRATRVVERIESAPARLVLQTLVRLTTRKRGILVLAFVALLGVLTAAYRSCAGLSDSQIASADALLWAGTGDGLRNALPLYDSYLPQGHSAASERRDLAHALLAADYGDEARNLDYGVASALSVEGGAAAVLQQLARGNLAAARGEAEALSARFPNEWLATWTRGRIAVAEQDWPRADAAMVAARRAAPEQVLPLLGQLDMALRASDDERTNTLIAELAERDDDHPMIAIGRTLVAFGVNPLDARVANLEVVLPDPDTHTLSTRALSLITYVRARQALAALATNRVARALRGLESVDAATVGVRGQLLFAAAAALAQRVDEVQAAVQRARTAAPADSRAASVVDDVALALFYDAQRPDLIVEHGLLEDADPLLRARLYISLGEEGRALRLLEDLMNRDETRVGALRVLVDYHLRRGRGDRAGQRRDMLTSPADRAYGDARIALEEGNLERAISAAEEALRARADDLDSLFVWCAAMAANGAGDRALQRLNEVSGRFLLPGLFDLHRLEVLVRSGQAQPDLLSPYIDRLEANGATATEALPILALAYEAVGDRQNALATANRLLEREPNHAGMQALRAR